MTIYIDTVCFAAWLYATMSTVIECCAIALFVQLPSLTPSRQEGLFAIPLGQTADDRYTAVRDGEQGAMTAGHAA